MEITSYQKPVLTDNVNRTKFLKEIGIDTENITDEIKELLSKKFEVCDNDFEHGKFMAQRTFREVILLQVAERESLLELGCNKNDNFFKGLTAARLDSRINSSLKFLVSL